MTITFLIGNGFDLKQGLHTSYKEFYKWLQGQSDKSTDHPAWTVFKHDIDPDHEFWADLEKALGEYLAKVFSDDDAIEIINRLRNELQTYILLQDKSFSVSDGSRINQADLYNPVRFFPEGTRRQIIKAQGDVENTHLYIRVILFNYTSVFERLIEWEGSPKRYDVHGTDSSALYSKTIAEIEHIHGFCDDRGRLAVGVDNKEQIINPILAESPRVCRRYVKDDFNKCYELDHPERCKEWISNSNIICIYGMSLGESDRRWWDCIAHRLKNSNSLLFCFFHRDMELRGNNGPEYQEQVEEDRQYVLSRLGLLEHKAVSTVERQIFISYSSDIFSPIRPF